MRGVTAVLLAGSVLVSVASAATISGTVTDDTGAPVAGLQVLAFVQRGLGSMWEQLPGAQATTAADGSFRIPHVQPRTYRLWIPGMPSIESLAAPAAWAVWDNVVIEDGCETVVETKPLAE